jgi:hypothetical protein
MNNDQDNLYVVPINFKGCLCLYSDITCQEGYCMNCERAIYRNKINVEVLIWQSNQQEGADTEK